MTSLSLVIINLFFIIIFFSLPLSNLRFQSISHSLLFSFPSCVIPLYNSSSFVSIISPFFYFHHSVFYLSIFLQLIHLCCLIHLQSFYPSFHSSLQHYTACLKCVTIGNTVDNINALSTLSIWYYSFIVYEIKTKAQNLCKASSAILSNSIIFPTLCYANKASLNKSAFSCWARNAGHFPFYCQLTNFSVASCRKSSSLSFQGGRCIFTVYLHRFLTESWISWFLVDRVLWDSPFVTKASTSNGIFGPFKTFMLLKIRNII